MNKEITDYINALVTTVRGNHYNEKLAVAIETDLPPLIETELTKAYEMGQVEALEELLTVTPKSQHPVAIVVNGIIQDRLATLKAKTDE